MASFADGEVYLKLNPGFVIKTALAKDAPARGKFQAHKKGTKVFINVAHNKSILGPSDGLDAYIESIHTEAELDFPIITSEEQEDVDHAGISCLVFVCFINTKAVLTAFKNADLRQRIAYRCLYMVEAHSKGRYKFAKNFKFPKLRWKGPLAEDMKIDRALFDPATRLEKLRNAAISSTGEMPFKSLEAQSLKEESSSSTPPFPILSQPSSTPPAPLIKEISSKIEITNLDSGSFPKYVVKVRGSVLSSASVSVDEGDERLYVSTREENLNAKLPEDADYTNMKVFYEKKTNRMLIFV
ncbi:hypothetical protein V1512DRAFT_274682 [Lipomyces arxii]|uniref:uncharacterized protein n=1 Tax=Lipomyces arxii TaxID=56418 RepID=UPI0034D01337